MARVFECILDLAKNIIGEAARRSRSSSGRRARAGAGRGV